MDSRSQGRGRRQQGPGSREQGQSGQARPHSSQGKDRQHRHSEAAEGRGRPGARQHGAQVQRTTLLNTRHTETSNCAIVVAWQESERGRARQGSTPAHQLVERDSREAVSFVLPSDAYASRPPGQRGAGKARLFTGYEQKFFLYFVTLAPKSPGRRQKPWEII